MTRTKIEIEAFGLLSYEAALALQLERHGAVARSERSPCILWGEHPSVITLGKNASATDLHVKEHSLKELGISLARTDRGGKMTLHNPGQLVVYPIINLVERGIGPRSYVRLLEEATISLLREHGISAHIDEQFPGVWVGQKKIGAIGIRISQKVSMHGVSLNITNNLEPYQYFLPCGIPQRGVTSMQEVLGLARSLNFKEIAKALVNKIIHRGLS